ncbi:DEAD/DEAH box helicase [Polyangium jinanense]|uniref:DEAD/DEAH box helicase n=1 Tax=Polyangium jinanense TaxID=2829994 RepID=A0A9X3XI49_9BACT|nr:DEAD/DEAH box helicase [Polyangium jinanense]MDC3959011.1 DEAD/DEAH box helicase [Polyangium jinanense]MDC3988486.1 DEAD/DEAH box helicase [Polyangium jinanense]
MADANESAFERLGAAVRYHIVHTLGFSGLRPVQELTAHAILDGDNCVVLAPTAGGKTEAAFLPLLSRMHGEGWGAPSVLYLSPIKALLNNQEPRLTKLAGMLSRRVFKWHGDIGANERGRFTQDPADILMTTPESLEVMLVSSRVPSERLFRALQAVVIDEVHAFAGDDRGAHLVSLLERLQRHAGRDLQRIGLSATVGNPLEILAWLGGTSRRKGRLVDPPKPPSAAEVHLDWVASVPNAAKVIAGLDPGKKRLAFVDSRRRVEQLGEALQGAGVTTFLMHSSLSADERRRAEQAFESGSDCVIVATSTMELGIDVGDLDVVYQVDAPPSVASFLQRIGRAGRRAGTKQRATFLCTKESELALSAALLRLWKSGYVEPVRPERAAFHVLAQQILALCLQEGGVPIADWWAWVAGAVCFSEVTEREREMLLGRMLSEGIVVAADGRLILGPRGEALYARRNFQALYAIFEAQALLQVFWGPREVGTVDAFFVQSLPPASSFVLGGKAWQITHIDWKKGLCEVAPAPEGRHLNWMGPPRLIARRICEELRRTLLDEAEDPWWTKRAREAMRAERAANVFLADEAMPVMESAGEIVWHTFLGGRANNLLAKLLEERLGSLVVPGNMAIKVRGGAARSGAAVREAIRALRAPGAVTEADAVRFAASCAREPLSKFQPCLPEELELRFLARRVVEVP